MSDEFYIGYEPCMPQGFASLVRKAAAALLILAAAVPALLLYAQQRSDDGLFEYGTVRQFAGTIIERPYPLLDTGEELMLLVAPFKFGAGELVNGLEGQAVRLSGTLIEHDGLRMVEVRPGSVRPSGERREPHQLTEAGATTLSGEIVDPKCYLGVMKPATRQVHRDCAVRCLSGGIPPMFVADVPGESGARFLLLSPSGEPLGVPLDRFLGRPMLLSGRVTMMRGLGFLAVEAIEPHPR